MKWVFRLLCTLLILKCDPTAGLPLDRFFSYGDAAGDAKLLPKDEGATGEVELQVPFVFYGETYFSLFVNINGIISFLTEIPYFFNSQFPLDYPVIAPFYSDVDLTGTGNVYYRETSDPTTVKRVSDIINEKFQNDEEFVPASVFLVTWDAVASFQARRDKVNTYQVILATNRRDSYAIFNYADGGLQWLQGDGKTSGLADALGQAGFVAEDGRLFTIRGSGTDQVRNLDKWSNVNDPGVWAFKVGRILPGKNIQPPNRNLEDSSEEEGDSVFGPGKGSCATRGSICHSSADCNDYESGFCCACKEDFYGNGINCVSKETPIRVTGKLTGNINGIDISEADLHSYVLSSEGRTYTAVSRIPKEVGYDLQSLTGIGEGIAWLFATPKEGVSNGFSITGGRFTRTVEVKFPQTGHKAAIEQAFKGLDVFNNVAVSTKVSGLLPTIPFGSELEVDAFSEEFTRVKAGKLRAYSSRTFRLKGQSLDTPYTVETFINFKECDHAPRNPEFDTLRMKVAENTFIRFDEAEAIVRYSFSAKIGTLEEEDPCLKGREKCGPNSQCIVDGDNFRCVCEQGYDYVFEPIRVQPVCLDVNECDIGRDLCDKNAVCINSHGSYTCKCRTGYTGDGYYCSPQITCHNAGCDHNAYCQEINGQPECSCNVGYKGDGFFCTPDFGDESCHIAQNCSPYAVCVPTTDGYTCRCLQGYRGNGYVCEVDRYYPVNVDNSEIQGPFYPEEDIHSPKRPILPEPLPTLKPYDPLQQEHSHQQPELPHQRPDLPYHQPDLPHQRPDLPYHQPDLPHQRPDLPYHQPDLPHQRSDLPYHQPDLPHQRTDLPYHQPDLPHQRPDLPYHQPDLPHQRPDLPYHQPDLPHQQPDQEIDQDFKEKDIKQPECVLNICWCPQGYNYDRHEGHCILLSEDNHQKQYDDADNPLPVCGAAKCTCPLGYIYNPIYDRCDTVSEVVVADFPIPICFDGTCLCPFGYNFIHENETCVPTEVAGYDFSIKGGAPPCNVVNNCHPNAQCLHHQDTGDSHCACNAGYTGNGLFCSPLDVSCDQVDVCSFDADCVYDDILLKSVCICKPGYSGDGLVCTPQDDCSSSSECSPNAQCTFDAVSQRYTCKCLDGYEGDGFSCNLVQDQSCLALQNCGPDAACHFQPYSKIYSCKCNEGYEGDGYLCNKIETCNILQNCGQNADCVYDPISRGFLCNCREGFSGDGFFCRAAQSCLHDPSVCHPDAICQRSSLDEYLHECVCLPGYTGDGFNCEKTPEHEKNILFINQGLSVLRMPIDSSQGNGYPIHVDPFMTAVGADVDCLEGLYYWTDVGSRSIRSSRYDGSGRKPVISGGKIGSPEDVAVDWVSKNLYWTDSLNDVVAVANLQGELIRTVIKGDLVNPRGITLHPGLGFLFWSDWNRENPKIERAGMDGSDRQTLISGPDVSLPNSLVVDFETSTLCWADAGTHRIECIGIQGYGRRIITEGIKYPFGLTLHKNSFFYSDWDDTRIHEVGKYTGLEERSLVPPPGGSGKLYGIVATPEQCPPVSNVCQLNSGNCPNTHLCLPNGKGGRTCACPNGESDDKCSDLHY